MSVLNCISKNLKKYSQDAAMVAMISMTADFKYRIHNEGEKTVGSIGHYQSRWYMAQRRQKGLQVNYVDLQFTGQLFRDLTYGQSKGQAVMGFITDRSYELHLDLEHRYGKIWRPTLIEQDDFVERFKDTLYDKLRRCGKGISAEIQPSGF